MRSIKNNLGVMSFKAFIFLCIFIIICAMVVWLGTHPAPCKPEDQVTISGILLGFSKNELEWSVKILEADNHTVTYQFRDFDKDYMKTMINCNVTITACESCNRVGCKYDLISCYIVGESD